MSRKHKYQGAEAGHGIKSTSNTPNVDHSGGHSVSQNSPGTGDPTALAPDGLASPAEAGRTGLSRTIAKYFQILCRWMVQLLRRGYHPASSKVEQKSTEAKKEPSVFGFRSILEGFNTVIGSFIGVLILGLIVDTCVEARKSVTEIRTIVVPKNWEDRGDSPEAVSQEVRRRASQAISAAGRNSDFIGNMELHNFEIDLSGNQISARSLIHLWRDKVYHNRRILEGGVVIGDEENWTLWVALTGSSGKLRTITRTLSGKPNREQILDEFTRVVLAATEQDVYASLLFADKQYEEMDRYFWHEVMDDDLTPERRENFWLLRAVSLVVRGRSEDSDGAFKEALRYSHNGSATNYLWAATLMIEGREDEAIRKYEQVIGADRRNALAYNNLGRIHYNRGNHDAGIQYFLKAVMANPKCAEAWNNLGAAEIQKASPNWEQALEYYLQSIAANPDYVPALINVCVVLTSNKKPPEGLPFCQRANELRPKDLLVLSVVRDNLSQLGRKQEAETVNNQILSIAKEHPTLRQRFDETIVLANPKSDKATTDRTPDH